MKHAILMFLVMTLTGCGLETIASMPTEPENTAESSQTVEEHPLAPVDEIMSTKGLNRLQRAVESEEENEAQDEPEVVAEEEETVGEVVEEAELPESGVEADDGEGKSSLEETDVGEPVNTSPERTYYGACRITFFCSCSQCCGQWAGGPTASGAMPTAGWTVANGSLPFGTLVEIEGHTYCVEDRGVSGDQFDIFVNSHDEALARGLYYADVYLIN